MTAPRNFRSAYFEKVGIKGVEEKKTLEILLKEDILDNSKLSQFCLKSVLPSQYRNYMWKVLLGILPPHKVSHDTVMEKRTEQYNGVREALTEMKRINDKTPLPEIFLKIYLIEEKILLYDEVKMMADPDNQNFMTVASTVSDFDHNPVDTYWIAKKFYELMEKYQEDKQLMMERVECYLQKEDPDRALHTHLTRLGAYSNALPITRWFSTGFADVVDYDLLETVWDKLVAGSCMMLVYMTVGILFTQRRPLLSMTSAESIATYLSNIPRDNGPNIVSKASELWHKNGTLLKPPSSSTCKGPSPSSSAHTHPQSAHSSSSASANPGNRPPS